MIITAVILGTVCGLLLGVTTRLAEEAEFKLQVALLLKEKKGR